MNIGKVGLRTSLPLLMPSEFIRVYLWLISKKFRASATHGTAGGWHCQVTRLRAQNCKRIRKVTSKNRKLLPPARPELAEPLPV